MTSEERREQRYQRRKAARLKKRQETIGKYDDFERVASLNSLYEAAREASKGVDWKASVQRYNSLLLFNISKTRAELLAGKDIRRGFICFDICERGKLRHIKSVHFSERVVQKSFCTNIIYQLHPLPDLRQRGESARKRHPVRDQQTDSSLAEAFQEIRTRRRHTSD